MLVLWEQMGHRVCATGSCVYAADVLDDGQGREGAARKALIEPEGEVTKMMKNVESLVASRSTDFYCGEQATLADINLFCIISALRSAYAFNHVVTAM
ncbi:MAG: hypothetical protein HC767_02975 [Akkermansiaceae bacterium]|nr:hypothetical protein [Akkermansiaceae bacterium]